MSNTSAAPELPDDSEPEPLGPDPRKMLAISVDKLVIDSEIQRTLNLERIERIAHEFDWLLFEAPTVVPLGDGRFRVDEGQTRVAALRKRSPRAKCWCLVLPAECLGEAPEADIALRISTGRRPHDALAQWSLRRERGDAHEILAEKVIHNHGLRLGRGQSSTTIAAVAAVRGTIHARRHTPEQGAEVLDKVLTVIVAAWPSYDDTSKVSRFDNRLLTAIADGVMRFPDIDRRRLVTTLQSRAAMRWINDALTAGPSVTTSIAGSIVTAYNHVQKTGRRLTWE